MLARDHNAILKILTANREPRTANREPRQGISTKLQIAIRVSKKLDMPVNILIPLSILGLIKYY